MDPKIVPLYYLSSLAGLVMVAGGIWLLYRQKIYIDRESKAVTEIDTPIGKFRTNVPALALFVLGFFPLIYPIVKSAGFAEEIRIRGNVKADLFPVHVYAVIRSDALLQSRDFSLPVPILGNISEEYKVIYVSGNLILEDTADLRKKQNGELQLPPKEIMAVRTAHFEPEVLPLPAEFR